MVIYHISDWHGRNDDFQKRLDFEIRNQKLDQPDLMVITGDMLYNFAPSRSRMTGHDPYEDRRQKVHYQTLIDYIDFVWPGLDIFAVRGNHDWTDYGIDGSVMAFDTQQSYKYMGLNIHGFRGMPTYMGDWNDELAESELKALCDNVPKDTDILITHCPPLGILDDAHDAHCFVCGGPVNEGGMCSVIHICDPTRPMPIIKPNNIGSHAIRNLVNSLKLKAHLFGHVHECGGRVQVTNNTVYSNGSCTLNKIVI